MDFNLPPLDTSHPPLFLTADACRRWTEALPLSSPAKVQAELAGQIGLLARCPLDAAERLAILEVLWKPLKLIQDHCGKLYCGKPVPLESAAQSAFETTDGLWQALVQACLRCVDETRSTPALLGPALRGALTALLDQQFARAQAHQAMPAGHWALLHELITLAEAHKLLDVRMNEANASRPSSPLAAYAEAMLMHTAGPSGLRPAQLAWLERWLREWSSRARLCAAMPKDSKALPLCIDLSADKPAGYLPGSGPQARFLDTEELRQIITDRLTLLEQGRSPAELHLGEDCSLPACGDLLRRLNQAWCRGGVMRRPERSQSGVAGRLIAGVDNIYRNLSGGMSLTPPTQLSLQEIRKQREAMATFGNTRALEMSTVSMMADMSVETDWTVFDENASGFRLERPARQGRHSFRVGQLVAVRLQGKVQFMLATVSWITMNEDQLLQLGVGLLPGPVSPIAIKAQGLNADKEPMQPGFLLPALAATHEPASVLLPPGRFRPGRLLDFKDSEGSYRIRLTRLLRQGEDFERASFEAATPQ